MEGTRKLNFSRHDKAVMTKPGFGGRFRKSGSFRHILEKLVCERPTSRNVGAGALHQHAFA